MPNPPPQGGPLSGPPLPLNPGSGSGLCGLTKHEWHGVLTFVLLREHQSLFGIIGSPLPDSERLTLPRSPQYCSSSLSPSSSRGQDRKKSRLCGFGRNITPSWLELVDASPVTYVAFIDTVPAYQLVAWREKLFKNMLPQHDIPNGLLPGPGVHARHHPTINFILASLFSSMRQRTGSP